MIIQIPDYSNLSSLDRAIHPSMAAQASFTALDASTAAKTEEVPSSSSSCIKQEIIEPSSKQDIQHDEEKVSDLFRAGGLFERHRGSGVSQDNFLKLLFDLQDTEQTKFSCLQSSSVDFMAGRAFHLFFDDLDDTVLDEGRFKSLLLWCKIEDLFLAGRLFERYAKGDGLGANEFQKLCRSSSALGAAITFKLKQLTTTTNPPNMLDSAGDKSLAKEGLSTTGDKKNLARIRLDLLGGRDESKTPHPAVEELDVDILRVEVRKRLTQVEKLDKQIVAFEEEAFAEGRLKEELPDAYSAGKEKMLTEHASNLKDKRDLMIQSVKQLRRHLRKNRDQFSPYDISNRPDYYPYAPYEISEEYAPL